MKKTQALLLLTNKQVKLFLQNGTSLQRILPKDVLLQGEIGDRERFQAILKDLLMEAKVKTVLVVLSDTLTFDKEVTIEAESQEKDEFFDMVPYERVITRVYKIKDTELLVAANSDLCEEIMSVLEPYTLSGIIPQVILEKNFPDIAIDDVQLFKKIAHLQSYSFIHIEEQEERFSFSLPYFHNRRFLILAGTFLVLIVVLLGMLVAPLFHTQPINKKIRTHATKEKVIPTATPSGELVSPHQASPTPEQ